MQPQYKCPRCQTEYFSAQECDWCPGVRAEIQFKGDCRSALERAYEHIKRLDLRARRFDAVMLACHRMGGQCKDVIKTVIERIRS